MKVMIRTLLISVLALALTVGLLAQAPEMPKEEWQKQMNELTAKRDDLQVKLAELEKAIAENKATLDEKTAALKTCNDEARAAAKLNHPNICTIHEVGEAHSRAFIVMEYLGGQPLSAVFPKQGLALDTVLEYGIQVADAVAYAHAAGIVHRDLKSSNIVITGDGRPKVLDFGLALQVSAGAGDLGQSTETSAPRVVGTLESVFGLAVGD